MFRIEEHHTNIKTTKLFYSNRFNMNIYNTKSKYLNGYTSYQNYLLYSTFTRRLEPLDLKLLKSLITKVQFQAVNQFIYKTCMRGS